MFLCSLLDVLHLGIDLLLLLRNLLFKVAHHLLESQRLAGVCFVKRRPIGILVLLQL